MQMNYYSEMNVRNGCCTRWLMIFSCDWSCISVSANVLTLDGVICLDWILRKSFKFRVLKCFY